jgi:hypothetical protein
VGVPPEHAHILKDKCCVLNLRHLFLWEFLRSMPISFG